MVTQKHKGPGDNVVNKYENIVRSIQSRDLSSVIDNIMRDICYREIDRACEKLDVLSEINALETDVHLLLKALNIKVELVNGSESLSKNELLKLLKLENLPQSVWDVTTSILIDVESRTLEKQARARYDGSGSDSFYVKEAFYERLATKEEITENYESSTAYDLSEQELTGLVRGAIRVQNFEFAFELASRLHEYYSSTNSKTLLLYAESCALVTRNQHKHFISLGKQEKEIADRLILQLLVDIEGKSDKRHTATLINLLNLTYYLDRRLYDLGRTHIDEIRKLDYLTADFIGQLSSTVNVSETKFDLVSDSLDLEQFARLDFALENKQIQTKAVTKWVDKGGAVQAGDDYINSFFDLYLRASVCSIDDKKEVQRLDNSAKKFLELDSEKFVRINPFAILRLCDRFIELNLPLYAVEYLNPFLSEEAWVSPIFECYLNALFASEKFDLFLSQVKHLELKDKTTLIFLREAQIYERLGNYEPSIESAKAATNLAPNSPYAWQLLLYVSRVKGVDTNGLKKIIFDIPESIFSSYDESKVSLVNQIAIYVDANLADRVLVDWFVQNPDKLAKPLTDIHANCLQHRINVAENPYLPKNCRDGVVYSDGFETYRRILVSDVDASHPCLLAVDSPLGQTLENMQIGEVSGNISLLQRYSPYVAAFQEAADLRHKGNDGTDAFRKFSLPANEDEYIPYFESILRQYSLQDKKRDEALQSPNFPLMMRAKITSPSNPIRGAITHLTSKSTSQNLGLFSEGEEKPHRVIVDIYTAVYLSLMGFSSILDRLDVAVIIEQHTRNVLEAWIEDILREDYMSMGVSDRGLYRITSEDIQRDSKNLIEELKALLEFATVEVLKPADTPEMLVKIREFVDDTVYSTFQLSAANNIPLLCIDHLMCELVYRSGCPAANMNSFVMKILNVLSLEERKNSIQFNLFIGTPVPILYSDVIELSRSSEASDTYLVLKFMEKYGKTVNATGSPLMFLTEIVRNVTTVAYKDGEILAGGRAHNPLYDGYADSVFNYCCRSAMLTLDGETAEEKFSTLIYNVINTPSRVRRYVQLISLLASEFAVGHFLDFDACNATLVACQKADQQL
ncbi:hypothetical protein [Vibrio sp. F74]|uniref:GapS6b family protein n=1 Tax=Vibrio sp. F74 TaxID=700020 RepID=UPI0035F558BB